MIQLEKIYAASDFGSTRGEDTEVQGTVDMDEESQ